MLAIKIINNKKICSKCKQLKNIKNFDKDRYMKSGYLSQCKLCRIKYKNNILKSNPKYYANIVKKCHLKNKNKRSLYSKKDRKNNPKKYKLRNFKSHLKTLYNLTFNKYKTLLKNQNGKCKICRRKIKLSVDHCHKTNTVRGLLCRSCNFAIGLFKENITIIKRSIKYLENAKSKIKNK